jgi:hypothetical protein
MGTLELSPFPLTRRSLWNLILRSDAWRFTGRLGHDHIIWPAVVEKPRR